LSLNRFAKRRDKSEPPIIAALEGAGFEVWPLDKPCDLAVRKNSWPPGIVQLLECKTPRSKKGTIARDKRQAAQLNFLATTQTPIVRTPLEALKAVGAVT